MKTGQILGAPGAAGAADTRAPVGVAARRPDTAHDERARISTRQVQDALHDGGEIALFDVREAGEYGEGHPFFAVNAPYSRLELDVARLAPRRTARIVVYGDGEALAARAAARLAARGYAGVRVLAGGLAAWREAGLPVFAGVNVPSKAFGELVERACATPHLSARELADRQRLGQPLALLDGRTVGEFARMSIPGGVCCPNGELAYRWRELVPDAATPIVINCAGRTRSIIGAQTLIDLGVSNPVYALENGTQGWMLADLPLDHGSRRVFPARVPEDSLRLARHDAERLARRSGVPAVDAGRLGAWLDDAARTTFLLDVRTAEEFADDSLAGARHAPGGQLIQATDQYVGVRGARLVLFDSDGVRAKVVAAWLRQMGWEAWELEGGLQSGLPLRAGHVPEAAAPGDAPALPEISPAELAERLRSDAVRVVDLRASADYRVAHVPGATWSIRPRLARDVAGDSRPLVLVADDAAVAELAATEVGTRAVRRLAGGFAAWRKEARPVESTPDSPPDRERIDFLFFTHGRHEGDKDAARQYLAWETGLLGRLHPQDARVFKPGAPF